MTLKLIMFDFDGTIADTLDAIVSIINRFGGEFGYKQISPEEVEELKNLTPRQIILRSRVSIFKIPYLVRKVQWALTKEIKRLTPISGIKEVLLELKNQGNQLGIITSNSEENILLFFEANGLQEIFDFVCSGSTLFGKSKIINNLLKKRNLKHEEVIYVGDETRDIQASKRSHIKIIAVSWGFNSKEVLAKHKPDFLIHQPKELIEVIVSLQQS